MPLSVALFIGVVFGPLAIALLLTLNRRRLRRLVARRGYEASADEEVAVETRVRLS